jgi:Family of unknown function (DUF5304)
VTAQPGPLAEEAARLVEALTQWARTGAGEMPIATGGAECRVCPFCQLLAVVRHTRPETFAHLAEAGSSLMAAVRTVVETHRSREQDRGGVEHINLDDDAGAAP